MRIPIVTRQVFGNLAGAALAADLEKLSLVPGYKGLVLFSDLAGEQLAILPVGPAETYARLEELDGITLEGLRPLCALRLGRGGEAVRLPEPPRTDELARLAESLREREIYLAECERRMAEVGQTLAEREAILEQRELALQEKERDFFRRSGSVTERSASAARQA
jgi:hypothetical protein